MLQQLLNDHVLDSKNTTKIFKLAREYDKLGQGSAAITLYTRAADMEEENELLQYKCLIFSARICERQTNRQYTMLGLLQHAAALLPHRPDAHYHLSRYYENKTDWRQSLIHAKLGLLRPDLILPELGCSGKSSLIYQSAVAAWCISGTDVCRKEVFNLKYKLHLDEEHEDKINGLLKTVGYPYAIEYTRKDLPLLKNRFKGSERINKNYSQHMQDMFVLSMLNGKENGTYLEFGSGEPFLHNNTALLETVFGWKGVSLDNRPIPSYEFSQQRKNTMLCVDATAIDYNNFFKEHNIAEVTDYLQLDIDGPTLSVLKKLPLNTHKFRVITFEHDTYDQGPGIRNEAREFLLSHGYILYVGDAAFNPTTPYEDWYVHPDYVDVDNAQPGKDGVNFVWDYMMKSKNE
jgi:hypothetical protein